MKKFKVERQLVDYAFWRNRWNVILSIIGYAMVVPSRYNRRLFDILKYIHSYIRRRFGQCGTSIGWSIDSLESMKMHSTIRKCTHTAATASLELNCVQRKTKWFFFRYFYIIQINLVLLLWRYFYLRHFNRSFPQLSTIRSDFFSKIIEDRWQEESRWKWKSIRMIPMRLIGTQCVYIFRCTYALAEWIMSSFVFGYDLLVLHHKSAQTQQRQVIALINIKKQWLHAQRK